MGAVPSAIQFIDTALSCTTPPFALSYTDTNQKWLIREHLLSLLQDYPNFRISMDTFIHNDGSTFNLLYANCNLYISNSAPPIPLTIWLHENYPCMPPMVLISSNSDHPIHPHHPFVEPSGSTTTPYLKTWVHPRCNLSDLVHNLVKLFSHDHPFGYSPVLSFSHPSFVTKMEALDRLAGALHYDMLAVKSQTEEEMEGLSKLKAEMEGRADVATSMIIGLEHEKMNLEKRVEELVAEADVIMNWLKVNHPKSAAGDEVEDAFEAVGEEFKMVHDLLAADLAMEDLIYALDKAVEEGVVSFEIYIMQIRRLARDQFFLRHKLVRLKGSEILHFGNHIPF